MRRMNHDDAGVSTVIGAIIVLAILGISIVSVNAYQVPRQGEALESAGRENAEAALMSLASAMSRADAPFTQELPLRPPAATPPLLAGIVLTPARIEGRATYEPDGTRITISQVIDAPPGGVPADDPMRAPTDDGRMRVYSLGNTTTGHPTGALLLQVGGAYLDTATYRLETGTLILERATGSTSLTPLALHISPSGTPDNPATKIAWRIPILAGAAADATGTPAALAALTPGPTAHLGGGQRVHEIRIEIHTTAWQAWTDALQTAIGTRGTLEITDPGDGTRHLAATIPTPPDTPPGTPGVELDLSLVRHELTLTARTS